MVLFFASVSSIAQNSINILGNSSNNYLQNTIQNSDSGYIAFGTRTQLGLQHFSFTNGNDWQMSFYEKPSQSLIAINGTGGVMDNDSTFVVLGRVNQENTAVIKASKSGRIIWSYWYSTGLDEHPDKIIKLKNGDFLVSTRTNVDYYEFGEWGSHAAVFRIDNSGKLLWSRLLDYRSANTSSFIIGMYETPGNTLLLTQKYGSNLGMFKLSANGDSITSLISNQSFNVVSSDYNASNNRLYVAASDNKILCFDSSLNLKWNNVISSTSLNSLNLIKSISDSTLCIGGKYSNEACLLFADSIAKVKKCYYKRFFYATPSKVVGFYKIEQNLMSLSQPGFAVTQHNNDLSNSCFTSVNGSVFNTSNNSQVTFKSHVRIKGSATWDEWKNIVAVKSSNIMPSTNCKSLETSVQPDKSSYLKSCRNVSIRVYITNNGTTNITKLSYRIYANGNRYDSVTTIPAIGSKSSAFCTLKTLYLNTGTTQVSGKILKINDQDDEFSLNDSFTMSVITKPFTDLKLAGNDTNCEGTVGKISSNGKSGTYNWYKNYGFQKQNVENFYNATTSGKYYAIYTDSGCVLYSDTVQRTFVPGPAKPSLTENAGTLSTNAKNRFLWYYQNQIIDSLKASITVKGAGEYKVVAVNEWGCKTESNVFNYSAGIKKYWQETQLKNINNRLLQWQGPEAVTLVIYTGNGKEIRSQILYPQDQVNNLKPGIYFLEIINNSGQRSFMKALIDY